MMDKPQLSAPALASRRKHAAKVATGSLAPLFRSAVFRLTVMTVALIGLAAALILGAIGYAATAALRDATQATIDSDVAALRRHYTSGGLHALTAAIGEQSQRRGGGLYFLGDPSGVRTAGNLVELPSSLEVGGGRGTFDYPLQEQGQQRIAAGVAIDLDGRHVLVVGRDIEDQRRMIESLTRGLVIGLGALSVLGIGAGLLLARRLLGRIDAISDTSEAIMAGDLSGRIPIRGSDDELDRLALQLNDMLERIERLMTGMREVSDNIAHDLKTPLNRLRNRAEAALSDRRGEAAWREGLERSIEDADALIKTFNALLLIARLEAGAMEDSGVVVDVAEVAIDVAELYEPTVEDAGFRLEVSGDAGAFVKADRQLLGQTLANLIDNALKYGAIDGKESSERRLITIGVAIRDEFVELTVGDRGPGIRPEDRARAMQRFGRLDASRSQPGTGLGLSLVAAVARMHGGTLRLEDNQPGLRVVLSLPLARQLRMIETDASSREPGSAPDVAAKA